MKTYSVVFWNNTCAIIPDNWIDYETQSFRWPKTKNPVSQIIKAVPPSDDFFTFQYKRVVGSFDSYDKARDFEIDSQNISTNDDEGFTSLRDRKKEMNTAKTRTIRKPKRYCTTSSDDEAKEKNTSCNKRRRIRSLSSSSEEEGVDPQIQLPPVPSNYLSKDDPEVLKTSDQSEQFHNEENHSLPIPLKSVKDSEQTSDKSLPEALKKTSHPIVEDDLDGFISDDNGNQLDVSTNDSTDNRSGKPTVRSIETIDSSIRMKVKSLSPFIQPTPNLVHPSSTDREIESETSTNQFRSIPCRPQSQNGPRNRDADVGYTKSQCTTASTSRDAPGMIFNDERRHGSGSQQSGQSIASFYQSPLKNDTNQQCHGHACCRKLFTELSGLKKTVSAMYLMMLEKNNAADETKENHINLDLDIKSQKQLTLFENKLKNPATAAQYKLMVKRIGGKTCKKHIRNALSLTLSDDLAYRMSWTGAKGTIMVKNMQHMEIIKDCMKGEWSSATDNVIETVIKNWLQHAGDRLRPKNVDPAPK